MRLRYLAGIVAGVLMITAQATSAAAPVRATVDGKGILRLSAPTMKKLGVKVGRDGLACLEFPASVLRRPPRQPHSHGADDPRRPQVWAPVRADGSLVLRKTRLIPGKETVPGPPGTVYLVSGQKGRLVLDRPAPARKGQGAKGQGRRAKG